MAAHRRSIHFHFMNEATEKQMGEVTHGYTTNKR